MKNMLSKATEDTSIGSFSVQCSASVPMEPIFDKWHAPLFVLGLHQGHALCNVGETSSEVWPWELCGHEKGSI